MVTVWSYGVYLALSLGFTIWVATTLFKHGRIFLVDTFDGNELLADSVNRLLLVGFYLLNIGYISLALRYGTKPRSLEQGIEFLSTKMGLVLIVLGLVHFFNLYVFSRMRRKALLRNEPPPVAPNQVLTARLIQSA